MGDMVNHPSHYNLPNRKECIDEMIDKYGSENVEIWCILTAYKYWYRAGNKDGNTAVQDLAKGKWYTNKAEELYNKRKSKRKHFDGDLFIRLIWLNAFKFFGIGTFFYLELVSNDFKYGLIVSAFVVLATVFETIIIKGANKHDSK